MAATVSRALRIAHQQRATRPADCPLGVPWGYGHIAAYLGVKPGSVEIYHQRATRNTRQDTPKPGDIPPPDGWTGENRGPWWWPATIIQWELNRPGRGAGGGRPQQEGA